MSFAVDRRTFLGVCRESEKIASRSIARLERLTHDEVCAYVPIDGRVAFVGSLGGGDEQVTFTRWRLPSSRVVVLPMMRTRLHELELAAEHEPEPAAQLF